MKLFILLALVVAPLSAHPHKSADASSNRNERLFFSFITIARDSCNTGNANFPDGTCYSAKDCANLGGVAGTTRCAQGLGVCCQLTQTCGQTIYTNRTYFVNPSSPNSDATVVSPCRTRVDLIGNNVCQLRLDFRTFSLSQPSAATSLCDTDSFRITGTTNDASVPNICGENAGQHLYVDVDPSSRGPTLEIDTTNAVGTAAFARRWSIEVTQIQCDSVERAPNGCRQYYHSTSGTVRSFNFMTTAPTVAQIDAGAAPPLQLHLANQNYRVCIMQQTGFCSIRWTPTTARSFIMTGFFIAAGAAVGTGNGWINAYTITAPATTECADYVVIPGGAYAAIPAPNPIAAGQSDRYCGGTFPTVTSSAQPFGLHVRTDGTEPAISETANVGFSLNFRMLTTGC